MSFFLLPNPGYLIVSNHEFMWPKLEVECLHSLVAKVNEAAHTSKNDPLFKTMQYKQKLVKVQQVVNQQSHHQYQEHLTKFIERIRDLEEMFTVKPVEIEKTDDWFIEYALHAIVLNLVPV